MHHSSIFRRRSSEKIISNINITPLVDVMLVLLIVFMVTAPMMTTTIQIDLPETGSSTIGQTEVIDEPLTITIDRNNNIYIFNTRININNLSQKLKAITKQRLDTRIFIKGDKNLSYGAMVNVFTQITNAGFTKVALITNKLDEQR